MSEKAPTDCTHIVEPKEGFLHITDGYVIWVYSKGEWRRISLWARLRWLLIGRMSDTEEATGE